MDSLTIAYGLVASGFCSYLWWLGRQQAALSARIARLEDSTAAASEQVLRIAA